MWVRISAAFLACAALIFSSCSGDDEEAPAGGTGGQPHSDGSNSSGAEAPDQLADYCETFAAFICDRCASEPDCTTELEGDCKRNAAERDPGGYTKSKGQACLDALTELSCDSLPRDCAGNLAVAECNHYLDGQTNGADSGCP
jgi:hypothetical protein